MSETRRILIQLDADPQCSTFDSVVAVDAGAEVLLRHSAVTPEQVPGLVHGAMFTRSPRKLASTAIFIGGSDADAADALFQAARETFFGPVRVSLTMDASGCNTTSAAAVHLALKHLDEETSPVRALVLGSTGAVGRRIAQLLHQEGHTVICHSRRREKAQQLISGLNPDGEDPSRWQASDLQGPELVELAKTCPLVFAAGAAGICFFDNDMSAQLQESSGIVVDLNAVPPAGISGVAPDADDPLGRRHAMGALTVGNLKMALHKAVIRECFAANDREFELQQIYQLVKTL